MSKLVARSREKNAAGTPPTLPAATKPPETPPSTPPATPPATPETPPGEPPKLANLLGKALKFTQKPAPTTPPAAPATPPAAPAAPPATPPAAAVPPAEVKKPAKGKKPSPAPVDATAMASAAATAATEAAMRAIQSTAPPKPTPLDNLSDDDRRDYEVAEHLAKIDPRFADAPKIVLDHITRAEEYAARWEAANPGKEFDASSEDHDEFFSTLQRPWSPHDFNEAKIDLAAEKKLAKFREQQDTSLQSIHQDQAHIELAPVVERKFGDVTVQLAKAVGDDVHALLTTKGWEELHKSDPVTAQVLATTLDQMHPFIEAAIEIDDPKLRVKVDIQKPAHAQWNNVVSVGEARLVGTQLEDGRIFAKRADYVKMKPAQQANHWYLTTDMIIQGAMDYAAEQVKLVAESQKERLKQLGFTRQAPAAPPAGGTPPTPPPVTPPPNPPAAGAVKPTSPTVGAGPKIGDGGDAPKSSEAALMKQISGILHRR